MILLVSALTDIVALGVDFATDNLNYGSDLNRFAAVYPFSDLLTSIYIYTTPQFHRMIIIISWEFMQP